MKQNLKEALQHQNDFESAKSFLDQKGKLKTIAISNGSYRVEIEIEGILYSEEGEDSKIAIIRLRNQFN